ncbi:MAG TPA: ABC transporter substrate-binding protein [Candidatus Competibacter sp.]|nr:ABC transporter substrate-binding protein [Candidatus Competibacteraceae bacterium]HRE54260.1 ABC transporter substrate-binding protein [Candidatus Competibacter sp.]HUM94202.1 ABC transporter substrate-binding protein [Candidatus Competibacter sp.]
MMHSILRSVIFLGALMAVPLAASAVDLTISCGAVGQERELCEQATSAWAKQTGHRVTITTPSNRTNERYFQYLVDLGAGDSRIDVYQIDIIWPGLLAKHLVDLKEYIPPEEIQRHFPAIVTNNMVDGRLVGMPWFTDAGVLYYRKDLLEKYGLPVPQDWSELADTALYIQLQERQTGGQPELWGYVFQGAAYEGLSCNALEWIASYGGGSLVGTDGTIKADNPQAIMAVARAASWIGTVAPPRVLSFNEEDARQSFQLGNAVFMRNWPYAWALLNGKDSPVAGKVGVGPLPKGGLKGSPASVLGGWQLAVSKYSKNPAIAAELVRYLTGEAVQKQRAITGSYAPTIVRLYDDPELAAAQPFLAVLRPILENAVARPSARVGDSYMAMTTYFWETVHAVLQGRGAAATSLSGLQDQLRLLKTRGGW